MMRTSPNLTEVSMATRPTELRLLPYERVPEGKRPPTGVPVYNDEAGNRWTRKYTTTWRDDSGAKRTKRFGYEGRVGVKAAQAAYDIWRSREWGEKEHVRNPAGKSATYTTEDLGRDITAHAKATYKKRGEATGHADWVRHAMQCLIDAPDLMHYSAKMYRLWAQTLPEGRQDEGAAALLCADRLTEGAKSLLLIESRNKGRVPVALLEAVHLAGLRDALVFLSDQDDLPAGAPPLVRTRGTANSLLSVIQQSVRMAHTEWGRVPQAVAWALSQVQGLKAGRSPARESEEVPPVADDLIAATTPHLGKTVAAMVQFQRLTGCRPDEVCVIRGCDLEANGEYWIYRPYTHKTEHHGKERWIAVGPRATRIIQPFLKPDTSAFLFSPAGALAEWEFKSGQKQHPRTLRECYDARSYRQAVHRACDRAFPLPRKLARAAKLIATWGRRRKGQPLRPMLVKFQEQIDAWRESHRWNPNQLRHSWATAVRKQFGIEEAAIGLGHSDIKTAEIYAERDRSKAMEVARMVG